MRIEKFIGQYIDHFVRLPFAIYLFRQNERLDILKKFEIIEI